MSLSIVTPGETRTRVRRTPNFPLAGTLKPYGLYPVMATPVLPGETLEGFEMKRRMISMPIRNPLVGAWLETWLVYVKITDWDPDLAQMFLSVDYSTTGYTSAGNEPRYFSKTGQIRWIQAATETVWREFFADQSELDSAIPEIDGVPMVKRRSYDWTHNLMFTPADLEPEDLPSNPEGQLTGMQIMALAGMTELTYEKYLQQYGVSEKAAAKVAGKPEILRYIQEWATPTNQIDPSTGAPSSAWAFSGPVKADKAKRFDEPGFLVVLQAVRPKMFNRQLDASRVGELWGFADFFPSYNLTDPAAGIIEVSLNDPPFATGVHGGAATPEHVLIDSRDLLTRGEQFVNDWDGPYRLPEITTQTNILEATSLATMRGYYPLLGDINALFTENTAETPVEARRRLYYEGIATMEIRGHVKDTTL